MIQAVTRTPGDAQSASLQIYANKRCYQRPHKLPTFDSPPTTVFATALSTSLSHSTSCNLVFVLMLPAAIDDSPYRLRCFVEGDSTVFTVKTSKNCEIDDLKKLVHQEKDKGILRNVNASDLILLKVSNIL